MEFYVPIGLVVESKGVYVDLNVRNGRRLLKFGDGSGSAKQRVRETRTKEASMMKLGDLHPDAMWYGMKVVEGMQSTDLKVEADGSDLKNIEPLVLDPEKLQIELEVWNVARDPPPENKMELHNYVDPDAAKAKTDHKVAMKNKRDLAKKAKQAKKK